MPADERATGKDIILDIVENMRAYQEELLYSSVVPTAFEVHLHPDDYDRLQGIFPNISAEACRALDEELARQNRQRGPRWLRRLANTRGPAQTTGSSWTISFFRDENGELRRGEVLVDSQLALPAMPELGAGTRTRRITTARMGQQTTTTSRTTPQPTTAPPVAPPSTVVPPMVMQTATASAGPLQPARDAAPAALDAPPAAPYAPTQQPAKMPPAVPAVPAFQPSPSEATTATETGASSAYATLTYEDNSGRHTHAVRESQLVIGRGGAGYWVDVRVDSAPDVSREHVRLRRDASTGQFFLKDLSLYGTTVNGQRVGNGSEAASSDTRADRIEVPLPPVARIGLADMVFLEFRANEPS